MYCRKSKSVASAATAVCENRAQSGWSSLKEKATKSVNTDEMETIANGL